MDIARPSRAREKRIRRVAYGSAGAIAILLITLGLSRLKPAAPTVERSTVWIDTVKRGEMLRQVRGLGTLVPEEIRWIPAVTEGRVERRVIEPGAEVLPESVILELSNPDVELAALEAAKSNEDLLMTFGRVAKLSKPTADDLTGARLLEDLNHDGKLVVRRLERIERETAKLIESLELDTLQVLNVLPLADATLEQDPTQNWKDALLDIYKRLRPGEAANEDAARQLIFGLFFDIKRYDLGKVGRRFLNQKLGIDIPLQVRNLTAEDLAGMLMEMEPYLKNEAKRDDIDDLKNKRVRSVGELLQSQLRLGFVRMEKVARERMTSTDQENLLPGIILSVKPVSASIKSFFSSNQLSTFMDQTNPLSELTNKRRLSSLGPGGLQRTSAKLEVRDVHRSHYGRICPIETPEGPNIGLISQLTTHARVDEFGFIMTPYRRVVAGRVTEEIVHYTAQEETGLLVAPADTVTDWARFAFNTTLGLFGINDVASEMGLEKHDEDFGQTLGRWGVPAGPYLVESLADGRLLGSTGLSFETSYRASTGYVLARDSWGMGYATESLRAMMEVARGLGVERLYALCHIAHPASARVLEKNGFVLESTLRRHSVFPNLDEDRPSDVSCYALVEP